MHKNTKLTKQSIDLYMPNTDKIEANIKLYIKTCCQLLNCQQLTNFNDVKFTEKFLFNIM